MKKSPECVVCDKEGSLEYYRTKATADEIEAVLVLWKTCTPHGQELDRIHAEVEKREIERSVA